MDAKEFSQFLQRIALGRKEFEEAWRLYKQVDSETACKYAKNIQERITKLHNSIRLREKPAPYQVWGQDHIEQGAIQQMIGAMRLPVAVAGALMPDAHLGYGLPIGGVLATDNAVIPYAVGVDIACRMMLTVYPTSAEILEQRSECRHLQQALIENTVFGAGANGVHDGKIEHPILDEANWKSTALIRSLRMTAVHQIGTSGTGNHFVEWGELDILAADNPLQLKKGKYLALLSHSGSRGVGFKIADHYTKLAMSEMQSLDPSIKHLAWLELDRAAGQEYWDAMELAGKFASANHHVIHERVARKAGLTPIATVENHHNFAWREKIALNGQEKEVIVHRKGATPAGKGILGVIPGTMADRGFLVVGKGNSSSLNSASHGGGRKMSRSAAIKQITHEERSAYLVSRGVTLIGGGLDEAPQAYKSIEKVISAQSDLVDIIGTFQPKIVRMADARSKSPLKPAPNGIVDAEGD